MRPPSSIEPFTPSAAITLHPTLQAVLDNLDVQIEAELSRYRRQRRNPNAAPRRRSATAQTPALGILKQNIQLPQPRSSIYAQPASVQAASVQPANIPAANIPAARPAPQSPPHSLSDSPPQPLAQSLPIQSWTSQSPAQSAPVSGESRMAALSPIPAAVSAEVAKAEAAKAEAVETLASPAIASYSQQYDLSAYAPDSVLQRLMQQLEPAAANPVAAPIAPTEEYGEGSGEGDSETYGDYLASSEALLRSIAADEAQIEREPNSLLDTLLTPLGIGSMLLLLLSSTALGYVVMNPSSIGLKVAQPETTAARSSPPSPLDAGANTPQASPSPNLAAAEFLDLGLDTLSSIPKSKSGRPSAALPKSANPEAANPQQSASTPNSTLNNPPAAAARSSAAPIRSFEPSALELPPAPVVEPSLATVVIPAPPIAQPARPPHRAAPKPVISPEPISTAPPQLERPSAAQSSAAQSSAASESDSQPRYYVVTEYTGDPSLHRARGAVPDAYVRNIPAEGAKVQLGAFSEQAKAEELQQELRQQGIEAELYRP